MLLSFANKGLRPWGVWYVRIVYSCKVERPYKTSIDQQIVVNVKIVSCDLHQIRHWIVESVLVVHAPVFICVQKLIVIGCVVRSWIVGKGPLAIDTCTLDLTFLNCSYIIFGPDVYREGRLVGEVFDPSCFHKIKVRDVWAQECRAMIQELAQYLILRKFIINEICDKICTTYCCDVLFFCECFSRKVELK